MRSRLLTLALLVGCNPYDGDVGPAPFFCGPTEPRCPMDYTCTEDEGEGTEICVGAGGGPIAFSCADDSASEPNGTITTATPTDAAASVVLDNLAICPERDKDTYLINIASANQTIEMIVTFSRGGATLRGEILNSGGVPIESTAPNTNGTIRASAANLPPGNYYAQVSGPDGPPAMNNYTLTLNVTGP